MLSLHTGYDTAYLTDAVGGADYYTGAAGSRPAYWQGAGAAALGLAGQVDADVMRALYHEDVGPDGQVLARRQRPGNYPAAVRIAAPADRGRGGQQVAAAGRIITPEETREIRLRLRAQWRTRVPFYDYTFSVPKSVSVLWASLLQAAAEAEAEHREADAERLTERAEQIRGAVKRANDRMIAVAEQRPAYVRTGHHSATRGMAGRARVHRGQLPAARLPRGRPQLHVHNAIANRAQRADGQDALWRALHGHPLFRNKLRMGTLADRFLAQELERIGYLSVLRADGKALEVGGISDEAASEFSTRSKELRDKARELEARSTRREHGHAPGKRAQWAIRQWAATDTRDTKDHNPPPAGQQVARGPSERNGAGSALCPRSTKQPRCTRRSTGRAACRGKRSGPGSSARRSPRSSWSIPRGICHS